MLLSVAAINTRLSNDLLETLTAMFNALPAIALLPLALLWFGLGTAKLIAALRGGRQSRHDQLWWFGFGACVGCATCWFGAGVVIWTISPVTPSAP